MTWTKLGDEFSDEARDLTDAEYRTHTEALMWSNRRGLDLLIPKRDVRKFAESELADVACEGLVAKGWWADEDDYWNVGLRFPEWQLERAVIEKRREGSALRMRRSRLHKADDHSLCLAETCPHVARNVTRNKARNVTRNKTRNDTRDVTRHPVRVGTGLSAPTDPLTDQSQKPSQDPGGIPLPPDPRSPHPSGEALSKSGSKKTSTAVARSVTERGSGGRRQAPQDSNHVLPAPVKTGSVAKSQNRRLHNGSETMADDAQGISPNDSDSATAGTTRTRARGAAA